MATGTVFLYARSMQRLAVRVFDEDMQPASAHAMQTLESEAVPLRPLVHIFSAHSEYLLEPLTSMVTVRPGHEFAGLERS